MPKPDLETLLLSPEDVRAIAYIDVDGTALREKNENSWKNESWFLLTKGFGANISDHIKIYSEFRANITQNQVEDKKLHDQMVSELLEIWREGWGGDITIVELTAACRAIKERVSEELKAAVRELVSNKILVIMGTGGFELAAKAIAESLDLEEQSVGEITEYWFGNTEFIFNGDGILTGFEHNKDVSGRKAIQADEKTREIFETIGREVPVFAVGDSLSDLGLFTRADIDGVAFNSTDGHLRMAATAIETDWPGVTSAVLAKLALKQDS